VEKGKAHQLHCRGINLSDFYVNSIHFIYSATTISMREGDYNGRGKEEDTMLSSFAIRLGIFSTFARSFCANFRKINL